MNPRDASSRPPKFSAWVFRKLFSDRGMDTTTGDLEEVFLAEAEAGGPRRARRWYRIQLLRALPHRLLGFVFLDIPMFVISLKIMARSLKRHKAFAALSLLALTVGLACFFLIFLYARYESTYDSFHPDAGRVYRLMLEDAPGDNEREVAGPAQHALESAIEEVEATTRTCRGFDPLVKVGTAKFETAGLFVDDSFFRMFRFPLVQGREMSMSEPGQVILSERTAHNFFGDEEPFGRVLDFVIRGEACRLTVSGIVANPPANTHFVFDLLISYPTTRSLPQFKRFLEATRDRFPVTYVKIRRLASVRAAEGKIAAVLDPPSGGARSGAGLRSKLQPLSDVHLRPDGKNDSAVRALRLFLALSVLVLLVAVVNHVNLATARSGLRRQEIGIRKAIGAQRRQLVRQFVGEAVVLTAAAFLAAAAVLVITLPAFGRMMERDLRPSDLLRPTGALEVAAVVLLVGLAAGFYPAFLLSSFRPSRVLKEGDRGNASSPLLRNALVVVQFAAAVALVVISLFVNGQVRFIRDRDPGFEKGGVVETWAFQQSALLIKQRLLQHPAVAGVTMASNTISLSNRGPLNPNWGQVSFSPGPGREPLTINAFRLWCDPDFPAVFNIRVIAGRGFSEAKDEGPSALVNETLARRLGPGDPTGKTVRVEDKDYSVIGIIKDFHFQPLHAAIGPALLVPTKDNFGILYAKFKDIPPSEALAVVQSATDEFIPEESHAPIFLEDRMAAFYRSENKQAALMSVFSTLAVVIAGLGLFGLAAFAVERRTREIGIRKVLGARTGRLFLLISSGFVRLLAVATVIGWPAAFYFADRWMSNFAYHVPVRIGTFLMAAAGMLVMTFLVSGTQVVRISLIDPVRTLKHE